MLTVSALITEVSKGLRDIRDTGDVSRLNALILKATITEDIIRHVIEKKGCDTCPSYGKKLND